MTQARKLARSDLWSLEQYHDRRVAFRAEVVAHKRNRQLAIGPHLTLYFEDRLTVQYQIQEMLRVERIFEAEAIQDELDAYNPLIPDGDNWKATLMLEFEDPEERKRALQRLVGIESRVWMEVDGCPRAYAIADEDLDRATADKTSAVHFLRFQLDGAALAAARAEETLLRAGVDHPEYRYVVDPIPPHIAQALKRDLQ
jgi:hypothetical protein